MGGCYSGLQNVDQSIASFLKALELDPTSLPALMALSELFFIQLKFDEALPYLQKRLELGAPSASVHYQLSCCYFSQYKFQEAIEHAEKAEVLDPKNAQHVHQLAMAYMEVKRDQVRSPLGAAWLTTPGSSEGGHESRGARPESLGFPRNESRCPEAFENVPGCASNGGYGH